MSRTGNDLELKPFTGSTTYFSGISCAAFFILAPIKDRKNMETIIVFFFSTEMDNNKDGKTIFRQVCIKSTQENSYTRWVISIAYLYSQ